MRVGRFAIAGMAALAACAAPPMGPMVQVIPGPGKPFDQFRDEDFSCRRFAQMQIDGQAQAVNDRAVGGAGLSTALGAGLGAIVGGGSGAAVGAVTGAGLGVGMGAGSTAGAQGGIQYQYDNAYAQCMYARGNQVPGMMVPAPAPVAPPMAAIPPSDLVRATQMQLARLGYPIAADGVAGPQTVNAIQAFQAAHGFPPDGMPSPQLLAALQQTPPGY